MASAQIRSLFGPRIRALVTGGASTPELVLQWVRGVFRGVSFADSYGTTESGAITTDGVPVVAKGVRVRLSPVPALGYTTVNEGKGAIGEVVVSSPNMTAGYAWI